MYPPLPFRRIFLLVFFPFSIFSEHEALLLGRQVFFLTLFFDLGLVPLLCTETQCTSILSRLYFSVGFLPLPSSGLSPALPPLNLTIPYLTPFFSPCP